MKETIFLYEDDIGCVQFVDSMGSDATVVNAARVSFGSDSCMQPNDRDKKLISYLALHKHTSPFEHCCLSLKFTVPLFVARQHMRHRTFSYNEISRRYTSKDIQFYSPPTFRKQSEDNRQASIPLSEDPYIPSSRSSIIRASSALQEHVTESLHLYNSMIEAGVCREQARMILPQNMYTEYYCTGNLLNWLKFVGLRVGKGVQVEMEKAAQAASYFITTLFPVSGEAWLAKTQ